MDIQLPSMRQNIRRVTLVYMHQALPRCFILYYDVFVCVHNQGEGIAHLSLSKKGSDIRLCIIVCGARRERPQYEGGSEKERAMEIGRSEEKKMELTDAS